MRLLPRSWRSIAGLAAALAVLPSAAAAECPDSAAAALIDSLPLTAAARTRLLELPVPENLYRRALARPGLVAVERHGTLGQAVVVVGLPVERLWMAVNDDTHHAEGDYLPLEASRLVSGRAAHSGREVAQSFERFGIGRWWVNRLDMSRELYRRSDGALWELTWHDVLSEYPGDDPPVDLGASLTRIDSSEGAWLLERLTSSCTAVEYVARAEPGGFVGAFQWLAATRTLRSTVAGMVELARHHLDVIHPEVRFVRPDGTPLETSAASRTGPRAGSDRPGG